MSEPQMVILARHAMATRFEIVLLGDNPVALRAAGEEALDEIDRLESRLSLFRPDSEIARVNAHASRQPVRVTPEVLALLSRASALSKETGGAFDITVAPLVRCWGFMGGTGRKPSSEALAEARTKVGMQWVELDPDARTVRFSRSGVMLDLGAIGKGYAVERASEILRDAGVSCALIHGGTSTIQALGSPPGQAAWSVAIEDPKQMLEEKGQHGFIFPDATASEIGLLTVKLRDEALSVSAIWGKCFESAGRLLGHVLDPRSGEPTTGALIAAVISPSATETDALSTALLVLGCEGLRGLSALRPDLRALVATESGGRPRLESLGIPIERYLSKPV